MQRYKCNISSSFFYFERRLKISSLIAILTLFTAIMTPSNLLAEGTEKMQSKKIIFETDMCTDVDDVGALAVLHALADNGEAEILVDTPEGEIVVATARRHDFVGEIAILIDIPRTATVRAQTELTALVVTKETFLGMAAEFPDVAIEIMRELAQRLADTTEQLTAARAEMGSG